GLEIEGPLRSDVAPINDLVARVLESGDGRVVAMKDPTRGGLASARHERADKTGVGIVLEEQRVPLSAEVRAASELLGIDPLHVANEGKAVLAVRAQDAEGVLRVLRSHPQGREAAIIATAIAEHVGGVVVDTGLGR